MRGKIPGMRQAKINPETFLTETFPMRKMLLAEIPVPPAEIPMEAAPPEEAHLAEVPATATRRITRLPL